MDDFRIVRRVATSLGLRREDVRFIATEREGGRYHALAILLPNECSATSQELAAAINDAVNIEAGLGNGALLDLWGARHWRFMREARWFEKMMLPYLPHIIEKKYAHLAREVAFAGSPLENEHTHLSEGHCALVLITSCRKDGRPLLDWKHDSDRTEALLEVMEKHEETLRTIVRKAAPSHHLLAAPLREEPPMEHVSTPPRRRRKDKEPKPVVPKFVFTPVFTAGAPASMKINA